MTPADQGLSTLGMLMQLAGSTFAAFTTLLMLAMIGDGNVSGWMLAVFGLSITRSFIHRNAGKDLLYGVSNRLGGIDLYVIVALVQSLLVALIAWGPLELPLLGALGLLAGLAIWPLCLAYTFAKPRFRRFQNVVPLAEDKGFEGASIVMTVLGLSSIANLLLTALIVIALIQYLGGLAIMILVVIAALLTRSILHVQAGLAGLRETTFDQSITRAKRYADFSMTTAFALSGALLMFNIALNGGVIGLGIIATSCWLLLAWPMIVRQFFADRQISALVAGDDAPPHHRAPDAGLTNLGWLLLATAMMDASFLLPELFGTPLLLQVGHPSIWFAVAMAALQAWAGAELIRMSPHARFIAAMFGTIGTLAALYVSSPAVEELQHMAQLPSIQVMATMGSLFLGLVLPPTTLVLVTRKTTPTARVRI